MLDFSKLTSAVQSVASLAASHAELAASHVNLTAIAESAAELEARAKAETASAIAALETKAQSELDSIVAALEAALSSTKPLTTAEAVGITAVATALATDAPVSPTQPTVAAPAPVAPVAAGPAGPLAVGLGLMDIPSPKTVEEYNALRAQGLLP